MPATVRERLLETCERSGLDVVVAHTPGAVRHLTGGWYSHNYADFAVGGDQQYISWLAVDCRDGGAIYLCSALELGEARLAGHPIAESAREGAGFVRDGAPGDLADAIADLGGARTRVGLELPFMPAPTLAALKSALPDARIADAHPVLLHVRAVKTEREVELLAAAAALLEGALAEVFECVAEGVSDTELDAAALRAIAARGGVPQQRFIVPGLGPGRVRHGAGMPVGYELRRGDVVLADLGAKLDGMHGDLVRMASIGDPSFPVADALELGAAVNAEVAATLRPGMTQKEAAAEAQRIADRHAPAVASWGVPTPLNHGLGWSLYEPPFDLAGAPRPAATGIDPYDLLEEGMAMSLETAVFSPGNEEIYANVEDPYVLRADGCARLNSMSHELIECGVEA